MSDQSHANQLIRSFHDMEAETEAEHISIDSGHDDASNPDVTSAIELNNLRSRFRFANRLHGTRYEYTLYEEGFLKARMWKKDKLVKDYYLALRFLSPAVKITRVVARRAMLASAGLLIAAVIAEIASLVITYDQLFRSLSILLGAGSVISFMLFLYWSHERTHFFTANGDCEVLRLMGSIESFRTCRSIVPAICQSIEDAQAQNVEDWSVYLRKEMHDHYRLHRAGAITEEACTNATRRILSRFD